jgi:DNA-binding NtrC family response regulator
MRAPERRTGSNVVTSTDDSSALKVVTEQQVDLAVIDYHMLRGRNGEEIAKEIKAIHPNLPLLMLTGYPQVPKAIQSLRMSGSFDASGFKAWSARRASAPISCAGRFRSKA